MSSSIAELRAQEAYARTDKWRATARRATHKKFSKIRDLKIGRPCTDCGNVFPPECMDFDHVRGKKFRKLSAMCYYSDAILLKEVAKCELVCANCHRIRTEARKVMRCPI